MRLGEVITRVVESCQVAARVAQLTASFHLRRQTPHSGNPLHLLIVGWSFPPDTNTGAQLPAFLARHASRSGWQVTVLCGPPPVSPTEPGLLALGMVPESVRLLRAQGRMDDAGEFHPQVISRFAPGIDGGYAEAVSLMSAASRALASNPPSHILATGPAFGNFIVGMRLARHFMARLCLQYRDEWTVMRPSWVGTFKGDIDSERECLRAADLVWFVNQGQLEAYQEAFAELPEKRCLVIPHGWDPDVMAQVRASSHHLAHLRGKSVIAFTGRATDATPMGPFLLALGAVLEHHVTLRNTLVLHITGNQTPDTLDQLAAFTTRHPGAVDLHAAGSQATAIEIMREATAVLLLNNTKYPGVVPLKASDYMVSGAPILVYGQRGAAGAMIQRTGAGIVVPEGDADELADALIAFRHHPKQYWNSPAREAWCQEHNRAALTDKVLGAMMAISNNSA